MSNADRVIERMSKTASGVPEGGLCLYALVDHAAAPGLVAQLRQWSSIRWRSLFEGSREARALGVAPILIRLGTNPQASAAGRVVLAWLLDRCAFGNAMLLLHSTWTLDALAPALVRRLDARLPDDMPVMLRYFDPRVFAALVPVLTDRQRADFLAVACRWSWLDRAGSLQIRDADAPQDVDPMKEALTLDAAQEAALIDAAEADAVALEIRKQAPDLSGQRTAAALHALIRACLPAVHRYGIGDVRQQALFCITAVHAGPRFHEEPAWQQALEGAQRDGRPFAQVLQEMESK